MNYNIFQVLKLYLWGSRIFLVPYCMSRKNIYTIDLEIKCRWLTNNFAIGHVVRVIAWLCAPYGN